MKERRYMPLKWLFGALSRLPFRVLYMLSDILFVVLYYIASYRRKVVEDNVNGSFPDRTSKERYRIVRQFYRNLSDYFFETIKLNHVGDEEIRSRMRFEGMDVVDRLFAQGRSITAFFSHCGNWEWVTSITLWSRFKCNEQAYFCQVYRPLTNDFFDRYFLHLRSRFNSLSFKKKTVFRDLLMLHRDGKPSITGFMSDQKPSHGDPTQVLMFLNHPTAMITGTETVARKLDTAVIYWDMRRERRGYYVIDCKLITPSAAAERPGVVTAEYARLLQQTIERQPSMWLWTHKRWKNPVSLPID